MRRAQLCRVPDGSGVARAAAELVIDAATRAAANRGRFTLALAGGSTPRSLYRLLADEQRGYRGRFPWAATHVFFGDERHVPPDHPDSNYRMAHDALLGHVQVGSVHRIHGELADAAEAAARYEDELRRFFGTRSTEQRAPRIDLVLLGLGPDGHTASLFPGSPALEERRRWVAAPWVELLRAHRITLTLPVLDRARAVAFLVSGVEKAQALAGVLTPARGAPRLPAARVRPLGGGPIWIADEAALARSTS